MTRKDIFIGIISGIIATCIGVFLYALWLSWDKNMALNTVFDVVAEQNRVGSLITLGAIPNLLLFFFFIKKRKDKRAKGVLIFTFVMAIALLISKFF